MRNDSKNHFLFAPLQSEIGQKLLKEFNIDPVDTDSIVLIEGGKASTRSAAALKIASKLKGLYPLLYAGMIIPSFIRNGIYNYIAKNRYKWFGKKESCMIPTPEMRAKFIS
jgi:predicted DCC family thiol-disulfide oxidoreductase YuxK